MIYIRKYQYILYVTIIQLSLQVEYEPLLYPQTTRRVKNSNSVIMNRKSHFIVIIISCHKTKGFIMSVMNQAEFKMFIW